MTDFWIFIAAWTAASVPFGMLLGKYLKSLTQEPSDVKPPAPSVPENPPK